MRSGKFLTLLFLLCFGFVKAADTKLLFDSANAAYAGGRFEDAVKKYEQILDEGKESSHLYFNLGNAYYKTGNIGLAILNYEKAKQLDPDDEDINENLKLANQQTEDKIEPAPRLFLSQWESSITDLMNEKEWSIFVILCICISLFLFGLYIFGTSKGLKQAGFFGGSILLLLAFGSFFMAKSKYQSTISSNTAVITSASVTVTGSPSEKGTKLFILHEGTKVEITDEEEEWTEIRIANGNVGWLKKTSLQKI
jgi:tetratricopeptide (TPR) repeat protein